ILRHRHDLEVRAAALGLQLVERRQLLAAGHAPGGPEIEQHDLAAEGFQRRGTILFVEEFGQRAWLPLGPRGKFAHLAVEREFGRLRQARQAEQQNHDQPLEHSDLLIMRARKTDKTAARPRQPKAANTMWGGRFAAGPAAIMTEINASIAFDKRLYRQDIAGSIAHCRMLVAQGLITAADGRKIVAGLQTILKEIEAGKLKIDPALEDIHMHVEARLAELIGEPAKRLHTARSRNDQVATDFRLWVRDAIDRIDTGLHDLQDKLLTRAEEYAATVMPGFTHLQAAQPVTFGHHLLAYVEIFGRDRGRLRDARARLNESPLGAAALAGTSLPIDRES